jgi:hypothetical protein
MQAIFIKLEHILVAFMNKTFFNTEIILKE